jgi:hypothetical protein
MPTIQQVADKMGITKVEAYELIHCSWRGDPTKVEIAQTLMSGYGWGEHDIPPKWVTDKRDERGGLSLVSLELFAKDVGLDEAALVGALREAGVPINIVARGSIELSVLLVARRYITGELGLDSLKAAARESPQVQLVTSRPASDLSGPIELTWDEDVPAIRITADIAALLSLTPISEATPPAVTYKVAIVPAFCRLETIEVNGDHIEGRWLKDRPAVDLSAPLRNIALGACDLLSKSSQPREEKEPDPVGKTQARMHDVILIRIRTAVSDAMYAAATEVMEGRRGYSQVLAESIPVRAHLARYRVGPGRSQTVLILRAAHRRGGPGTKERTYVLHP